MKNYTKLAVLGMFLALLVVVAPSVLAVKTGNYSNSINMERGTDGTLVITIEPGTSNCGNGLLQTAYGEQCDGSVGFTCSNLDSTWTGDLGCKDDCTYDTSGCSAVVTPGTTSGGSGGHSSRASGSGTTSSPTEPSCVEAWNCDPWSDCVNGTQDRTCVDDANCGTTKVKPDVSRGCSAVVGDGKDESNGFFNSLFTGAVIGNLGTKGLIGVGILIIVLLGGLWYVMSKKKKGKKK